MIYKVDYGKNILNEFYGEEDLKRQKMLDTLATCNYRYKKNNPTFLIGKLCIPRAYAREETKVCPKDPELVDHYEIVLFRQLGSPANRRSTYVLAQLPLTKEYVAVELFRRAGGADFLKRDHAKILRGTKDVLDRNIILGFCISHAFDLIENSYTTSNDINPWLKLDAKHYKASEQPKRLKKGDTGPHVFYGGRNYEEEDKNNTISDIEKFGENGIFSDVEFLHPLAL